MNRILFSAFLLMFSFSFSNAQDMITLMSYNLLNYPSTGSFQADTTQRNPFFRTIVSATSPDLLVVQEITSQAGVNGFRNNVMNSFGENYAAGVFIDGPDTDNAIFYKSQKFSFVSNTKIKTALRDINEFKLVYVNTDDTIRIFSLHLKASSGSANEASRAAEVDSLRKFTNNLPFGTHFVVCGDFNIYHSFEPAYIKLVTVQGGNEGHVVDPLSFMTGTWNNQSYAIHHTQSPRVRAFGGGSTGGLNDRFDMILPSKAVKDDDLGLTYVPGSVYSYGNDGIHYNDSINRPPNTAVSMTIANALHNASDHLPVIANFVFGGLNAPFLDSESLFKIEKSFPNPFSSESKIVYKIAKPSSVSFQLADMQGKILFSLTENIIAGGLHSISIPENISLNSGIYFYTLSSDFGIISGKLMKSAPDFGN